MVVSTIKKSDFPPENGTVDSYAFNDISKEKLNTCKDTSPKANPIKKTSPM